MKIKKLLELPISGSGCANIRIITNSVKLLVKYGFNSKEDGSRMIGQIVFDYMDAYRFVDPMHLECFADGSYDSLIEIKSSDWIKSLTEIESPMIANTVVNKKHYAIFFSENGYLEVVAENYKILPYKEGRLSYPEFDEYID